MAELLSCPFCASETAEPQTSYYHDGTGRVTPKYSVRCNGCGSSTKDYIKEGQAIEAWNTRTPKQETDAYPDHCPNCDAQFERENVYCPVCGAKVEE